MLVSASRVFALGIGASVAVNKSHEREPAEGDLSVRPIPRQPFGRVRLSRSRRTSTNWAAALRQIILELCKSVNYRQDWRTRSTAFSSPMPGGRSSGSISTSQGGYIWALPDHRLMPAQGRRRRIEQGESVSRDLYPFHRAPTRSAKFPVDWELKASNAARQRPSRSWGRRWQLSSRRVARSLAPT